MIRRFGRPQSPGAGSEPVSLRGTEGQDRLLAPQPLWRRHGALAGLAGVALLLLIGFVLLLRHFAGALGFLSLRRNRHAPPCVTHAAAGS